jgi:ATP-dependent Lon protease
MASGIYSAIYKIPIDHTVAMTGEISIHGNVKPIGGVYPKVKAAKKAGAKVVIIPEENMQSILQEIDGIEIIPVNHLREVFERVFIKNFTIDQAVSASIDLSGIEFSSKKESV